MTPRRFWTELTWTDFQSLDLSATIAVLPVAAIEQHGPHLPVGVDSYIMEGYLRRVCERLPDALAALFLPVQTIGVSIEHDEFPGTLSLSADVARRAWTEIAEAVFRTGCRKLVILNSHGGNAALVDLVARDLRARLGMFCVAVSWRRFGYPDGLFDEEEIRFGIHAGDVETSLMLAFREDLVRTERLASFSSAAVEMERELTWLRAGPPIGFGWMAQDLNESGAVGDASQADIVKGEAAADYGATAFVELLQDIEAFDIERLAKGPLT